jgi:hypothetical protein
LRWKGEGEDEDHGKRQDSDVFTREIKQAYPGARVEPFSHAPEGGHGDEDEDEGGREEEPAWIMPAASLGDKGYDIWFWDAEQPHGLPGCLYEPREGLMDGFVSVLQPPERGGWIQVCWLDYNWGAAIEEASMAMKPTSRRSSVASK